MGWWDSWGRTAVQVGGQVYNARQQRRAARAASRAQVGGLQDAINAQMTQYTVNNMMADPYRATGTGALNALAQTAGLPYMPFRTSEELMSQNPFSSGGGAMPSDLGTGSMTGGPYAANMGNGGGVINPGGPSMAGFFASPDYLFRFNEGARALERSAAARSGALNGNTARALSDYGQNTASGEFNNWWNRMSNLAGIGQTATTNQMSSGAQLAGNIGNAYSGMGNARASGILGGANANQNGLYNYLNYAQSRWG